MKPIVPKASVRTRRRLRLPTDLRFSGSLPGDSSNRLQHLGLELSEEMADPRRDTRLRASCDRCHELKNRCARTSGPDSRCERCDRLDIDCVYSSSMRIGRPPGQKSNSNKDRHRCDIQAQSPPPKRQARAWVRDSQAPLPSPITPSSGVCAASSSSQRIETHSASSINSTSSPAVDTERLPIPSAVRPPEIDFESDCWLDAEAGHLRLDHRERVGRTSESPHPLLSQIHTLNLRS